jgi:hypothetical protein
VRDFQGEHQKSPLRFPSKFFVDDKVDKAVAFRERLCVLFLQTAQCDLRATQQATPGDTLRTCHLHPETAHSLIALTAENDVLTLLP